MDEIMSDEEYFPDDLSWQRLFRHRCCPPDHVLFAGESERLSAHLEICPWCRDDLETAFSLPSGAVASSGDPPPAKPGPGEIRPITEEFGGWGGKGRYFNPPLVLVLNCYEDDRVEVVQLYDDLGLAGPDDVLLTPDLELFAETWNRFTLERDMLGQCYGAVEPSLLERCRGHYPEPEIGQGSLVWFFRHLEVECGYHFFRRSLLQRQRGLLRRLGPETLARQLLGLGLKCAPQANALQTLAAVRVPDELLPRAAHGGSLRRFGLSIYLRDGEVVDYKIRTIHLSRLEVVGDTLLLSGMLDEPDLEFDDHRFWWRSGGRLMEADPSLSGCLNGSLWAGFDVSGLEPVGDTGRLELIFRFFHYLSG